MDERDEVEQLLKPINLFFGFVVDLIKFIDFATQLRLERNEANKRQYYWEEKTYTDNSFALQFAELR
jgi:hypothetical protein